MEAINSSLGYSVCRLARKIHQLVTDKFSSYDITLSQWVALKNLAEHDGISQKQLALLMEKDQNNVKAIVDRLAKKELLKREKNPLDSRAMLLQVTPSGKKLVHLLETVDDDIIAWLEKDIDEAELKLFCQVLFKLEDKLNKR